MKKHARLALNLATAALVAVPAIAVMSALSWERGGGLARDFVRCWHATWAQYRA